MEGSIVGPVSPYKVWSDGHPAYQSLSSRVARGAEEKTFHSTMFFQIVIHCLLSSTHEKEEVSWDGGHLASHPGAGCWGGGGVLSLEKSAICGLTAAKKWLSRPKTLAENRGLSSLLCCWLSES